uniref:DUF4283 domain-containing protein n=1 Tax=Tanacetum cinerariifolium TaxID=118510 RepID=A0A6L2NWD5_TANCI|nr:hypothetical protein [Tanacetum cinerariifolium]
MGRRFFSQKGSAVGRGVKEKQVSTGVKSVDKTKSNTDMGTVFFTESDRTPNDANPLKEIVSPSVIDEHVAMEVQSPLVAQTYAEANSAGNALGKPSYANAATGNPNGKKVNVHTLFTPRGNGIDVVVLVDSIHAISTRFANTAYGFFLGRKVAYPIVANYVRNTWGKYGLLRSMFSSSTGLFSFEFSSMDGLDAMLENGPCFIRNNPLILKKWHPDENLLQEDVSTVPVWVKLHDVPVTAFSKDGLSAIAIELGTPLDNIVMAMPKITKECHYTCNIRVEYEWKPPRCSSCKIFRPVKNTGTSEKKTVKKPAKLLEKKSVEPTIEVSNSNPFDVLNLVDNDVKFGTNRRTTNLVNTGATLSGSSFMNIDNDGDFAINTPIGEKIDKIKRQICDGKLRLLDNEGNPLVPTGIEEIDSEVEVLVGTMGDSYSDNDDYDPYDDDMYENHDLFEHMQSICDDLDITIRGRKKK